MSGQPDRPKILIITAPLGAGHNQVARTMQDALRQGKPTADISLLDALSLTPRAFRWAYSTGFTLGMTRAKRIYGLGFRLSDWPRGPRRGLFERARLWTEGLFLRRLIAHVRDVRPDLVVNTHFLAAQAIGQAIQGGRLDVRQVLIVTDFVVHRWWYASHVEHWFAPSECGAQTILRWGIPPERITVSGLPIHPKWTSPPDRAKILADWALPVEKKIVVLSGGTEFQCGPVVKISRQILAACPEVHLVVLAGRNKGLLADLSSEPEAGKRLHPVAFTDRVHELVSVACMMITKPGGVTTAECLSRGVPMVLLKPVPGQEGGNAKFFQREGAAVLTKNLRQVVQTVRRLLEEPAELERLSENARRLYKPGTRTIVEAVARMISSRTPGGS